MPDTGNKPHKILLQLKPVDHRLAGLYGRPINAITVTAPGHSRTDALSDSKPLIVMTHSPENGNGRLTAVSENADIRRLRRSKRKLGIEPEHQHAAEYISNLLGFICIDLSSL